MSQRVAVVLFPDFQLLDVAGPIAAFEIASRFVPSAYSLRLCAAQAGAVRSSSGVALEAKGLPTHSQMDTLLVAGGDGVDAACRDTHLIRFLRRAGAQLGRTASVCSGALLLAKAGLLDNPPDHAVRLPVRTGE